MAARVVRLAPVLGALLLALVLATPAGAGSFNRIPSRGSGGISDGGAGGPMRGPGSPMGVKRRTAPDEPDDEHSADGAEAEEAPPPAAAADGDQDAEEAEDEAAGGERTFGKACVYGPRGKVLYAPPGRRCRLEAAQRRLEAQEMPAAAGRDADGAATGRCILGGDGRVLHAPPGVDCTR